MYKCNIETHLCNHHCSGKAINITYSECVSVALGTNHEMCMCHTVICGCPALYYFSKLSCKQHDFRKRKKKKTLLNTKYVF